MREAMVICAQQSNDGSKRFDNVKCAAAAMLARHFGGVSIVAIEGTWINDAGDAITEPLWQLMSAYEPCDANDNTLLDVACFIGRECEQDAVYVRFADGHVAIMGTRDLWQRKEAA